MSGGMSNTQILKQFVSALVDVRRGTLSVHEYREFCDYLGRKYGLPAKLQAQYQRAATKVWH